MLLSFCLPVILLIVLSGCPKSSHVHISYDTLAPCPDSPNCVSSLEENPRHKVDPFRVYISGKESLNLLKEIIKSMQRTEILWESGNSLYAVFSTRLGFADDVQFLADEKAGVIHVRSASRIGYWDIGANRKRIEHIRKEYNALLQESE
ncbi:MAG: DUF1499 domain-containing protein [Nitrospirota bacterium]